jgi:hypothetical protein
MNINELTKEEKQGIENFVEQLSVIQMYAKIAIFVTIIILAIGQ